MTFCFPPCLVPDGSASYGQWTVPMLPNKRHVLKRAQHTSTLREPRTRDICTLVCMLLPLLFQIQLLNMQLWPTAFSHYAPIRLLNLFFIFSTFHVLFLPLRCLCHVLHWISNLLSSNSLFWHNLLLWRDLLLLDSHFFDLLLFDFVCLSFLFCTTKKCTHLDLNL